MPRQASLDAPDTLHPVMVPRLEWHRIFCDDADRAGFVARLAALAAHGAFRVYAWALLPNHARLLVRTGLRPLTRPMRSLLTVIGHRERRFFVLLVPNSFFRTLASNTVRILGKQRVPD